MVIFLNYFYLFIQLSYSHCIHYLIDVFLVSTNKYCQIQVREKYKINNSYFVANELPLFLLELRHLSSENSAHKSPSPPGLPDLSGSLCDHTGPP